MNKIQIKKFIEEERIKTIKNAKQKATEEINRIKEQEAEESLKSISVYELEIDIEKLLGKLKNIQTYFDRNKNYTYNCSRISNAMDYLQTSLNKGIKKDIQDSIDTKAYMRFEPYSKFDNQKAVINEEFSKILGNVSSMTGVKATEYLKELGFEIPEENVTKNEIMAPINIALLKELRGGI
jgi:hypothetical protein